LTSRQGSGDDNGKSSRAQDEITATGRSTIAERISAEVKAGNCACEVKNPSGKCCLGSVTRVTQDSLRHGPVAAIKGRG
jgi:hypothetical protein